MIMAIIGGAIITTAQGWMLDVMGFRLSYLLPMACYVVIMLFALRSLRCP